MNAVAVRKKGAKQRPKGPRQKPSRTFWVLVAGVSVLVLGIAAAWRWTPLKEWLAPDVLAAWIGPYRHHWLGFPLTVLLFVAAECVFLPVLLLVLATGLVFGPWLGSAYALAGCMASAAVGYAGGHFLGHERLERWGGTRVRRLSERLSRKGVMAVFLARKIPAPYTLVNLVAGASRIRFVDFLWGTFLGMGTGVVALAIFGNQLKSMWTSPSWTTAGITLAIFFLPAVVAVVIQRILKKRGHAAGTS